MNEHEIRLGIYRHWKGPLYQVLGLAHDANADNLMDANVWGRSSNSNVGVTLGERTVVVYIALQLDGAHLGPRLSVRTLEDFLAEVHGDDGSNILDCERPDCHVAAVERFTYLGPVLTAEMIA